MSVAALDHLVYATPDLDATVDALAAQLGVRPSAGGQHPGRGTRNALLALSDATYLEVIGPDPSQPAPSVPRWFGIDALAGPRLVTWAAKASHLPDVVARAREQGVRLGAVAQGSRRRADGVLVSWTFVEPDLLIGDGLMPFLIDWGASPHPAASAARGVVLVSLHGEHPDPSRVREMLGVLDIDLPVHAGPRAVLLATLRGPLGTLILR